MSLLSPSHYSDSEDPTGEPPRGMSDEEELRRLGLDISGAEGLGEVLVDNTDDMRELGLIE